MDKIILTDLILRNKSLSALLGILLERTGGTLEVTTEEVKAFIDSGKAIINTPSKENPGTTVITIERNEKDQG